MSLFPKPAAPSRRRSPEPFFLLWLRPAVRWKSRKGKWTRLVLFVVFLCLVPIPLIKPAPSPALPPETKAGTSWIIQWKDEPDPGFAASSTIVRSYPDSRVTVAEPRAGESMEEWLSRWQHSAYVESVQPNQAYRIAASPNDPMISNQKYLEQIHAREAWDVATGNEAITIALVDTGVDLTHPDLVSHLVKGTNLINPGQPPADDNGHGTNVAGVIAASANNDKGIAGLLWKAKIMPVKALESNGTGEEDKLGEGIRYAVDHGAKIVVLSLGLNKASAYMESIVKYAESRGVLLVAASGNEGNSVKYPAAYPTVLAVGGASADNHAATLSNYGPELDVVAPWNVFTTAVGGRYIYTGGTSLAAPQVAAVSALAWSLHPEMKPYEIRNLIRQTAEDLETPGWDAKTGYGLLRADRALSEPYRADMYEPNNKIGEAKPTSVEKRIDAVLDGKTDEDWFVMEAPYDGTLLIQLAAETKAKVEVTHYRSAKSGGTVLRGDAEEGLSVPVTKGKNYIKLAAPELQEPAAYHMTTRFRIYRDPFEDNDRQYKAYTLPARSGMITGTFHQQNDQDWFVLNVERAGALQLKVTVDTARIDPTLSIQKKGERETFLDQAGDGAPESLLPQEIGPGTYYIRVSNIARYTTPVTGEYTLDIQYSTNYEDPNEPNDKPYQAVAMVPGTEYLGVMDSHSDEDWFLLNLAEDTNAGLVLSGFPEDVRMQMELYDHSLEPVQVLVQKTSANARKIQTKLKAGTYYIKLTADKGFTQQRYTLVFRNGETKA